MVEGQREIWLGVLSPHAEWFRADRLTTDYPKPLPTADAIARLAEQIERTDHVFWPDDISVAGMAAFDHSGILGPNQITDAYLLALAVKNDGRLATLDRGVSLRAVRGAEPRHLAVI